jgi:hypothetical protein
MTKKQQEESALLRSLFRRNVAAIESLDKTFQEMRGHVVHIDMLTGSIADLRDTIGSSPIRILEQSKALRKLAGVSRKEMLNAAATVIRRGVKNL